MSIEQKLIDLLLSADKNEICGTTGHSYENGADYYSCRACYTTTRTSGYADMFGNFNDVQHKPDCFFVRLMSLLSELE